MGFGDFLFGSEGTPGEHGIDTVYYDDYDDYAGIRKSMVDYWSGIMAGQEPEWLTRYSDQLLRGQLRDINRDYLGVEGDRTDSALGLGAQIDASMGTGKATNINRTVQDMMAKRQAARQASASYRQSYMGNAANVAGKNLLGLPQGQRAYSSGYNIQPTAGTEGFLSKAGGAALGAVAGGWAKNAFGTGGVAEKWGMA
jgi:hypothetical protein